MSKTFDIPIEFLGDTPYNIGNYKKVRTYIIDKISHCNRKWR